MRSQLAVSVAQAERVSPTEAAFRLREDLAGGLEALLRLAQREKACCPFFDLDLDLRIGPDTATLHVSVPPDGITILDSLTRLAS